MSAEHTERPNIELATYSLVLPEGSAYTLFVPQMHALAVPLAAEEQPLYYHRVAGAMYEKMQATGREVRLIADDSPQALESVKEKLAKLVGNEGLVLAGPAHFFELEIVNAREVLKGLPKADTTIARKVLPGMRQEVRRFQALMHASFGSHYSQGRFVPQYDAINRINSNIGTALNDPKNHLYLVLLPDGSTVGGFTVVELGDELQLHSVALGGKLPILVSAMFAAIKQDLPDRRQYPRLTFSALGAAQLYERLGFSHSNRNGIVLMPAVK